VVHDGNNIEAGQLKTAPPRRDQHDVRTRSGQRFDPQSDSKSASEPAPIRSFALRRREFLRGAGGAAAVGSLALGGGAIAGASALAPTAADAMALAPTTGRERQVESFNIRLDAAKQELGRPPVNHPTNGDEERFENRIGNFSKTLPHTELGEVDQHAYGALLEALKAGNFKSMEQVPRAGGRFTNPLGGLAFALEGPDTAAVELSPPPSITSPEWAADLVELYWMALLRDVPFSEYDTTPLADQARGDLARFPGYRGPRLSRASNLFRADYPGVTDGPMVSQFLLQRSSTMPFRSNPRSRPRNRNRATNSSPRTTNGSTPRTASPGTACRRLCRSIPCPATRATRGTWRRSPPPTSSTRPTSEPSW
jgi:hypothetical protein